MRKIFHIIVYIFAIIGFVLVVVYLAVEFGLTRTSGIIDKQHDYFKNQNFSTSTSTIIDETWTQNPEWQVLQQAIEKDTDSINEAAADSGVPSRMIVAPLVVEQLRLFHSDREIFKQIFAPLKILGNQSQFSWGVMGIKQDTAIEIENNLKDPQSPWYIGAQYEHTLDYPATTTDTDSARFARLTDEHNRYYSYLYAGLLIHEIETQWHNATSSIDISNRPDIIATIFNIGFENSHPNTNPQVGGAEIDIASSTYSFGGLAGSFYASDELINEFPR